MDERNCQLKLSQKRFFSNGVDEDNESLWSIPINIATGANPKKIEKFLFKQRETSYKLEKSVCENENNWINVNPDKYGFYRVKYESKLQKRFLPFINSTNQVFSSIDRLSIQQDLFSMCKAGLANTVEYLSLLRYYSNEYNLYVWTDINSNLGQLSLLVSHLGNQKYVSNLNLFVQTIFLNSYQKVIFFNSQNF